MSRISAKTRAMLRERSSGDDQIGMCEICGMSANNAHHRKNRSQGGPDALSNLILLCGSGVTGCHGHITHFPTTAATYGWTVKSYEDPTTVRVFLGHGWWYLNDDGTKEEAA